jgi:hypothetical protein
MTTEFILLLGLYAFIILGAFLGDSGPGNTFKEAGPRLGARVERNIATGTQFIDKRSGRKSLYWQDPGK